MTGPLIPRLCFLQLSNLLSLDLSANQLHLIPDALHHLSRLHTLTVAENSLSQLPASLSALTCLVSMDAGNNQLSELPVGVSALTRLQHIKVSTGMGTQRPAARYTSMPVHTLDAVTTVKLLLLNTDCEPGQRIQAAVLVCICCATCLWQTGCATDS